MGLAVRLLPILAACALFASAARADEAAEARSFIQAAAQQVRAEAGQGNERQRFAAILDRRFDVPVMGQFVLGRYWAQASAQSRQDFIAAFRAYLAKSYAQRFFIYAGRPMAIRGARVDADGVMVRTNVQEAGDRTVDVDWKLVKAAGTWRIVDVVVEGVSLGQTQRADFGSVLRANSGDVAKLTALLRQRGL